ncbi:complement C1q tumor necrosis factor-related protein 3-like [Saccostrea cucullata]|uniref:complement C1q tumor necrosis factor-related protein 3-like n=1 Tax=Saccostrea cuccullata TaxID=36930 RepID=UPI002ED05CC7
MVGIEFVRSLFLLAIIAQQGVTNPAIGFTATLSHQHSLSARQTIVYDKVVTNYGNGYDKWTGHFKAPIDGLYVFSCAAMAHASHHIHIEIVKNGKMVSRVFSSDSPYDLGTQTVVLALRRGYQVWARQEQDGRHLQGSYNQFSGYLISTEIY